ncbi:MAG: hypothetical protein KBT29_04920 [Prevotellaceae bacterium]|nr:hypothetical protein [Candidatus Minthosoma caballi]
MKKSIITLGILATTALGALTSCEDMMTVETGDKAYVNATDTLYSYLGIMRCMQDVAERQVILGEIRGDLVSSTDYTTDTLFAISNFDNPADQSCSMLQVSDYYSVINNCNFYIANADTSAIKSNVKYMVPEYAQVKAIRAWAYLQLVKNYKEVPYITKPINNLDVIKNFDYANNLVNKDNLIDKLIEDGLQNLEDINYPHYGNPWGAWENGFTSISSRLCYIPIRVILGDCYLLRGASTADYEKAAEKYFQYLKGETTPLYRQYTTASTFRNGDISYGYSGGWGEWASVYDYTATTNEVISLIPGSANSGIGQMLTRVADIYGYTPSSSQSSEETTTTNDNGEQAATGEYESSGAITVTRNYKRQYGPSAAYQDVNNKQTYLYYKNYSASTTSEVASVIENCDARYGNSVQNLTYEGEAYPLCCKAAYGSTFYYTIPTYRKTLIWLRLAEAINRAGFPEFAFAILKDGLNQYTLPYLGTRYEPVVDANGFAVYTCLDPDEEIQTVYESVTADTTIYYYQDADGKYAEYTMPVDLRWVPSFIEHENDSVYLNGSYGALYYVTDKEQVEKFDNFLYFRDEIWNSTYGIHARGAGFGNWTSSNTGQYTTNISGYRDSVYYDYSKLILAQGVNLGTASKDDIIDAVENIIVDELALETAFEGNRFTDLVRIAEHKNASGKNGTDWLAKKIANRGTKAATSTSQAVDGYDANLFAKLQNTANWYFSLPAWNK